MVETVSAQPLPQNTGSSAAVPKLEPGAELHAKVEANLPGGIVRLATADAKLDLRIPQPLPVGSEVTITVSGSKQQPDIQLSTVNPQPSTPSETKTPAQTGSMPMAQAGEASGQSGPSQTGTTYRPASVVAHLVQVLEKTDQSPQPTTSSTGSVPGEGRQGGRVSAGPAQTASGSVQTQPSTTQAPVVASGSLNAKPAGQAIPAISGNPATPASSAQVPNSGADGFRGQPNSVSTQTATPTGGAVNSDTARTSTSQQLPLSGQPGNSTGLPQQASIAPKGLASQPTAIAGSGVNPGSNEPTHQPNNIIRTASQVPGPNSSGPVSSAGAQPPAIPSGQTSKPGEPISNSLAFQGNTNSIGKPESQAISRPVPTQAFAPQSQPPLRQGQQPQSMGTGQAGPVQQTPGAQSLAAQSPGAQPNGTPTIQGQGAPEVKPTGDLPKGTTAPLPSGTTASGTGTGASIGNPAQSSFSGNPGAAVTGRFLDSQGTVLRAPPQQPYPALQSSGPPLSSGVQSFDPGNPVRQLVQTFQQPLAEQQAGLSGLFTQIGNLAAAQSSGKVSVPDPVVKAMQQILGLRLNSIQPLNGNDLQQAVRLSGQFRESQAFQSSGVQPTALPDLKSALLSFKALLQRFGAEAEISRPANQPAPPSRHGTPQGQVQQPTGGYVSSNAQQNLQSLLKETDAALARLRITQLANTGLIAEEGSHASSRPADIVVELPLSLGHETAVMQMQIGRDGGGRDDEEDGEPAWRLRFALDLTATGPLEAAISLRGGGTYASLWVDRKETYDNLNSVRETMEAAFADAGLDLQEFRLIRGLPPKTAARYGALIDRQS
ncbi:MAG: flagellar hook-length control protein FliK [Pseudomonadota bacterium]